MNLYVMVYVTGLLYSEIVTKWKRGGGWEYVYGVITEDRFRGNNFVVPLLCCIVICAPVIGRSCCSCERCT